jgi:hypothetical protein
MPASPPSRPFDLPWSQEERLRAIDAQAFWDDRVNRVDIMRRFDISVPQATNDLRRYQELAPNNLRYDTRERTYRTTSTFEPLFGPPSAESQLAGMSRNSSTGGIPVVQTPLPARDIDPWLLRRVFAAMREGLQLRLRYQDMESPTPTRCWVSPRAIASDGLRWHIRAYNHDSARHEDLLFPRIIAIEAGRAAKALPQDADWERLVDVRLKPASRLSPSQKQVIARDYGMAKGETTVAVRAALLFLFLRRLGIDRKDGRGLIEVANRAQVDKELRLIDSAFAKDEASAG